MKAPDPLWPGPPQSLLEEAEETQRKWKESWLPLNQQLKEISKWNTPVISCATQT